MASKSEKARRELLALAEEWEGDVFLEPAKAHFARQLRAAVDRLFPVKPPEPAEEEPHPIVTFPVLGGGTYGVGEAKLAELAKLYEVPVTFLIDDLGKVAAKIQAGAVSKKTRKGMTRALFSWTETAKRIYDRRQESMPAARGTAASPPPNNGKPRVFRMGIEQEIVVAYHGQTYRQEQWPREFGPWPG